MRRGWVVLLVSMGFGCGADEGGTASDAAPDDGGHDAEVEAPDDGGPGSEVAAPGDTGEDVPGDTARSHVHDVTDEDPVDAHVHDVTHADLEVHVHETELHETEPAEVVVDTRERWSDPATWGGALPAAGAHVVVPSGRHILLDVDPPPLAGLTIDGTLELDRRDTLLIADWILVHGALHVGSEADPFTQRATLRLTGADPAESVMGMGTRGILVMGGALELHGVPPAVPWTRIADHAEAGATALVFVEAVDWRAGDDLAIAPTDYYGVAATERHTLAAVAGHDAVLATPLAAFRWGRLQFVTSTGMSLTPPSGPGDEPAAPAGAPTVLDERAEVANLTRNIVIEAPDDALWQSGFGAHVMIMGQGASARVEGVAIRRAGQRGLLGRYAFHWHRLSYDDTRFIGDATGQYLRGSVVDGSANRGVVIHATNGVLVEDNVVYDIRGHGIFTEDAVERRNVIRGNLVLHVRNPTANAALKQHEIHENGGASGVWLANPDNVVTHNTAADCQGFGFWLAFPANPWGASIGVPMRPNRMLFGTFEDNTAHTSGFEGLMFDNVEIDNAGNVAPLQYMSTTDMADPRWDADTLRRFAIARLTTWKNRRGGVWDRVAWPDFVGTVAADNCGRFFAGSGADGLIAQSLLVGTSLNHRTPRPSVHFPDVTGGDETPVAFATYHSSFDIRDNLLVAFPLVPGERSGAFATEDYYIRAVDKGLARNVGNVLVGSHPGYRSSAVFAHYVLSGALWDPHGFWGPAGDYFVYDTPFFTHALPVSVAAGAGGVSVPGPFYGVQNPVVNNLRPYYHPLMALDVRRLDPLTLEELGTWSVAEALAPDWFLSPMRHFAAHRDGVYALSFPGSPMPYDLELRIENLDTADDTLVLSLAFDGAVRPDVVYTIAPGSAPSVRVFTEVGSRAAVLDSAGLTWWQDTRDDRVWVKVQGGTWQFWDPSGLYAEPTRDELLYEEIVLHVDTDP